MSVGLYTLNRAAAKGTYVSVDSRTNEEVKCTTKYICCDTGEELLPTDIKLYQEFGGIDNCRAIPPLSSLCEPTYYFLSWGNETKIQIVCQLFCESWFRLSLDI